MNTEVALILTVGGIVGSILVTQLWQLNWFKKERFKMQKSNIMAENRIKLKKLEREMGIDTSKGASINEKGGVLDLIKGLDRDKIDGLLDLIGEKESDSDQADQSDLGKILKMIPPSVIEGFVQKLSKGKQDSEQEKIYNE